MTLDFVAVGPQRTGTTWLHKMLKPHPHIALPRHVKETKFFDLRYGRGTSWYRTFFRDQQSRSVSYGEVGPTYFDSTSACDRIADFSPDAQVVISLRDPVDRAFSLYLHHLRKGRVPRDFREAVQRIPRIITGGLYEKHIPKWLSRFGDDQVHIIFLDDITKDPRNVLDNICKIVGVETFDRYPDPDEKVNEASMPRYRSLARLVSLGTAVLREYGLHRIVELGKKLKVKQLVYSGGEDALPELSKSDRITLFREYEESIEFVEKVTGRDLSCWRNNV